MGLNSEHSAAIIVDVETIPTVNVEQWLDPVRPDSRLKDPVKIEASKADKLAAILEKAALEPDLCEVVAVGYQVQGQARVTLTRADCEETGLLTTLWQAIGDKRIIGYNVIAFDIPVIVRRSQLLGVPFAMPNIDRFRTPHIDLMQRLSFNGALTFRSLGFYVRRFGLSVPPDTVSGADIASLVASGDWEAVRRHCALDVQATGLLARRLGYLG